MVAIVTDQPSFTASCKLMQYRGCRGSATCAGVPSPHPSNSQYGH